MGIVHNQTVDCFVIQMFSLSFTAAAPLRVPACAAAPDNARGDLLMATSGASGTHWTVAVAVALLFAVFGSAGDPLTGAVESILKERQHRSVGHRPHWR